jgi:hypothetical protein
MDKELLRKAFEAGRDYQYTINPYTGKPSVNTYNPTFPQWYNELIKTKNHEL